MNGGGIASLGTGAPFSVAATSIGFGSIPGVAPVNSVIW
jgi:hypothetical protein